MWFCLNCLQLSGTVHYWEEYDKQRSTVRQEKYNRHDTKLSYIDTDRSDHLYDDTD